MKQFIAFALTTALAIPALASPAAAAEEAVIQEVLAILKERGIVDDAKHAELVAKNAAYEKQRSSLLSRVVWNGDFRARYENFWYGDDALTSGAPNRNRLRYRLRIGAQVPVNEWLSAGFRLASGESENRSTNRTLGAGDDFDRDAIAIDEAYLQLTLPLEGSSASLVFGKQSNPFVWKNGKDYMVWDNDYSLEGIALRWSMQPTEAATLFANAGYFLIDENGGDKDPHFLGLQAGATVQAAEKLALGGRATWFEYRSLNPAFYTRQNAFGNVGLSDDNSVSQLELSAYVRSNHVAQWPVLLHAHFAKNFDAASIPGEGEQDTGWGVALEVGDAKQVALLGVGYYSLESDFAPALYIDSDVTDGFTNRAGWAFYATRQILSNTELTLELFMSDAIDESLPFATSIPNSDRFRLRTDVQVKF